MINSKTRSRVLALSGASMLALTSHSMAVAADAPAAKTGASPANELVVTGFRASLQSALKAKRASFLPIESVAPEDIGKMPDQNVAESLQRLPGVQIDRAGGQGTAVLIDGLRQNLTTLNGDVFLTGKEFYVSGEGSGGGAGGNNQYSSLEGVPSEEIGGIDVYKNPQASMTEGGLGGTINLKTRNPLDGKDGFTIGGNLRATHGAGTGSWTPDGAIVVNFKVNDRFAITGSFSYDRENTHTKKFQDQNRNQWVITDAGTTLPASGSISAANITALPNNQTYIDPQLAYFTDSYDWRTTMGASVGIAYNISDSVTTSLNWFYSRETDTNISYTDKVWFDGQGQGNPVQSLQGQFPGGCQAGATGCYTQAQLAAAQAVNPFYALPGIVASQPYTIDSNGVVQSGTFAANGAETATLYQHTVSSAHNFQWKTRFDNGGPISASLDVSYAYAKNDLQADQADVEHGLYNNFSGFGTSPTAPGCNNGGSTCAGGNSPYTFAWSNGGASGLPSVSYLAPFTDVLTNPNYTTFKSNWAWANHSTQKNWAAKGDISYKPSFITNIDAKISAGFRVAGRDIDQTFGRYLINDTTNGTTIPVCCQNPGVTGPWLYYQDPGYAGIPYSTAVSSPNLAQTVNNFAAGPITVKNVVTGGMTNPSTYLNTVWNGGGNPTLSNNTEAFFVDGLSSFRVKETTTAGYVMGDVGGPSDRFHINFGVRIVDTDLRIDHGQTAQAPTYYGTASWNGVDSNVVPVSTSRNYVDILPSFNFELDVTDKQKIRFDAARVVAPQDLFSLGLGNSYNFTRGGTPTNIVFQFAGGSSGNPSLDPYRATQMNLSWENYFAPGGIISVNGFYKAVDSFVTTSNVATTINGVTADVTEPVNGGKGYIYGLELGLQYSFGDNFLPMLKGFGVAANYTRSQSNATMVTAYSTTAPIPGVAKNAFTAQAYYERGGFNARISYSWRDRIINDSLVGSSFAFSDQSGNSKVYQVFGAPYGQVDAQIGYDITKRFGIVLSVQNLTDSKLHTYLQWQNLPFTYDDSGRRYFAGVKFKF